MKRKKKLPNKLAILAVLFVVIVLFILLLRGGIKTKDIEQSKSSADKAAIKEVAKEGEEACILVACKNYPGFRYDSAKNKCYCYKEDGTEIEGNTPKSKAADQASNESALQIAAESEQVQNNTNTSNYSSQ